MNIPPNEPRFRHKVAPWARRAGLHLWREWLKPILVILLVTGALRSALADWNDVPTGSIPTSASKLKRFCVKDLPRQGAKTGTETGTKIRTSA